MINEVLTIKQLLTNVEKLKAIEICGEPPRVYTRGI